MAIGDSILIERLTLQEAQLHQLADSMDVKASILLVAVTFLAGQTAFLLGKYTIGFVHWEQFLASLCEIAAGLIIWWFLRIQKYSGEAAEKFPKWRDDLIRNSQTGNTADIEDEITQGIIARTVERINIGCTINDKKACWLKRAYMATFIAFFFNLVALESLVFRIPCLFGWAYSAAHHAFL